MDEAFAIHCIGERLATKIEEKRLDDAHLEPDDKVFDTFLKIYWVGHAPAAKWIDQGHRTIEDLLGKVQLTKNQKNGIEHLDNFQTRIPRTEMDRHVKFVRETCSKIDASIQFIIAGSYRRGADESDFIVTRPNCPIDTLRTTMLETVIPGFFNEGYLKVGLATTAKTHGSKWQGAAAPPETTVWRRIDFLFVSDEELGAALMYFIGNDIFNWRLRLLASEKRHAPQSTRAV
jgi:DNA polymerase IV